MWEWKLPHLKWQTTLHSVKGLISQSGKYHQISVLLEKLVPDISGYWKYTFQHVCQVQDVKSVKLKKAVLYLDPSKTSH